MSKFGDSFASAYAATLDGPSSGRTCAVTFEPITPVQSAVVELRTASVGWVSTPREARSLPGASHVEEQEILAAEFATSATSSVTLRRDGEQLRAWRVTEHPGETHFRLDVSSLAAEGSGAWRHAVYWRADATGAVLVGQRLLQGEK